MTKEDKELLIRDLSARLPYGVKVKFTINENIERNHNLIYAMDGEYSYISNKNTIITYDNIKYVYNGLFEDVKPYLFPLSSMTKEQREEFEIISDLSYASAYGEEIVYSTKIIDFFNKNHFDYRGLIPKGLALDATVLNIY